MNKSMEYYDAKYMAAQMWIFNSLLPSGAMC